MTNEQLGTDIKLNEDNDIEFNYQDDFVLVSGNDNLVQAVIDRLSTGLGELSLHPLYGSTLPLLIGRNKAVNLLPILNQATREVLYQEPRIEQVINISTRFDSLDTVIIGIQVLPINSVEPLNIVYPFVLQ